MDLPVQKLVRTDNVYKEVQHQRVQQNNDNNRKGGTSVTITTNGNPAIAKAAETALNAKVIASNKRGGTRKWRKRTRRKRKRTRKNI